MTGVLAVDVAADLRFLLASRHRRAATVAVPVDPCATLGHVVESLGVPLTEAGDLLLDGMPVTPDRRADVAGRLVVRPVARPQDAGDPPRFLLDVHLGSLARRLRLLGLDAAYPGDDPGDDELVARAAAQERVLLTRDRGLLRRRALPRGAYVRGQGVAAQADDVLDRFAPPLAPWTRCGACGGVLEGADAAEVAHLVEPGTQRTYTDFARCTGCGRPYWRGAHFPRLEAAVRRAEAVVAARRAR